MEPTYQIQVLYTNGASEWTPEAETEELAYIDFKAQFKGVFERFGHKNFNEINVYYGDHVIHSFSEEETVLGFLQQNT